MGNDLRSLLLSMGSQVDAWLICTQQMGGRVSSACS